MNLLCVPTLTMPLQRYLLFSVFVFLWGMQSHISANTEIKHLRHVVCLKFKTDASPSQIHNVEEEFVALKDKIPGILSLEWGTNNSPENLNKEFTHCFIVSFQDESARKTYLPHPDHQAFVSILKPILKDVFVIDFTP